LISSIASFPILALIYQVELWISSSNLIESKKFIEKCLNFNVFTHIFFYLIFHSFLNIQLSYLYLRPRRIWPWKRFDFGFQVLQRWRHQTEERDVEERENFRNFSEVFFDRWETTFWLVILDPLKLWKSCGIWKKKQIEILVSLKSFPKLLATQQDLINASKRSTPH
jgi:hypothetical protein